VPVKPKKNLLNDGSVVVKECGVCPPLVLYIWCKLFETSGELGVIFSFAAGLRLCGQ